MTRPTFSLIVPTRGRPGRLRRFLDSVAGTAYHPERIEVVLVIDADDPVSQMAAHPVLTIRRVVGPSGRTMGALNTAGYAASAGDYIMLLNDDVIVRTPGWDATALACFRRFPDPIALVHVNDTLIHEHLCTFPLVSRAFCELAGGVCPVAYRRYRIDDHIEDVFNLLAAFGERRTVYLPDVVFEHTNAVDHPQAGRVYQSDPAILAQDAPLFDALFPARKELVLRLLAFIEGGSDPIRTQTRRATLIRLADPFALRTAGRQHVVRSPLWTRGPELLGMARRLVSRVAWCARRKGCRGLLGAATRQLPRMAAFSGGRG
jgi:hypothetical protein